MLVFLLASATSGCSSSTSFVRDDFDPGTAVTITTASAPLVFYRDSSHRAAFARDFVYLGPIQVNRMGSYRYYLWLGIWSAIPDVVPSDRRDGFESVTIFADGEPLQLEVAGWREESIGASEPVYTKPVASAADAYYEVTIDQIRLIAESRDLRILSTGPEQLSFEPWDNQQSAFDGLRRFVFQTSN